MEHTMKLRRGPFQSIKSGEKTVELRLYDEKRKLLSVGDTILFKEMKTGETLEVKVKKLERFSDFETLYKAYGKREIGYKEDEEANPLDMYVYYSKEEVNENGVLAITIERI